MVARAPECEEREHHHEQPEERVSTGALSRAAR